MKDIMTTTDSSNNQPPKEFIDYLHTLLENIIIKDEKINKYKKWFEKYCIEVDINYSYIETEIKDFIDLFEDEQTEKNTTFRKMLYKTGKNIFLTSEQIDDFYTKRRETLKKQKQFEQQQENILKAEIPKKVNDFVKKHKGEWNNFDWLYFKNKISAKYKNVTERRLTEIVEEKRQIFLQEQKDINNQQRRNDYNNAVRKNTTFAFEKFINKYKSGEFVGLAKQNIEKIKKEIENIKQRKEQQKKEEEQRKIDYDSAIKTNSVLAYEIFIHKYKVGSYIRHAKAQIEIVNKEIKQKETLRNQRNNHFKNALNVNSKRAFENFINKYKEGEFIDQAKKQIERLALENKTLNLKSKNEIIIKEHLTTGYFNEFENISTIQINDTPFAEGGFGSVFNCISVNNKSTSIEQVIKILNNPEQQSIDYISNPDSTLTRGYDLKHSFYTIQKLQKKISDKIIAYKNKGFDFFEEYPAFLGIPQFSFVGIINGEDIVGYSANNLEKLNFTAFDEIIENDSLNEKHNSRELSELYTIAYHLVRAFSMLKEIEYIHSDLKAGNLFISKADSVCAIIDYDSGHFSGFDSCLGSITDWLAPELLNNINNPSFPLISNNETDLWSVTIAIHYILYLAYPLFYLEQGMEDYCKKYRWPEISENETYFCHQNKDFYDWYIRDVKQYLPESIYKYFEISISDGMLQPNKRISLNKWQNALGQIIPQENHKIDFE